MENTVRRSRASASIILSSETFSLFAYSAARASSEEEMSERVTLWPSLAISIAETEDQTLLTGVGEGGESTIATCTASYICNFESSIGKREGDGVQNHSHCNGMFKWSVD